MSTLRQRLKKAKELLSKTYDTTITYVVVCKPTDTYENAIEILIQQKKQENVLKVLTSSLFQMEGQEQNYIFYPLLLMQIVMNQ